MRRRVVAAVRVSRSLPLLSFEGQRSARIRWSVSTSGCGGLSRRSSALRALNGHPQLEHVVDTPDRARRGTAGTVEQVARNCSATLAEDAKDAPTRVRRRGPAHLRQRQPRPSFSRGVPCPRLTRAFSIRPGQSMTTTGRSSSMNSNPIELWSVISASATKRYGDASGLSATCTRESRPSRCSRARQSAPPDPRSVGSYQSVVQLHDEVETKSEGAPR